MTKGNPAWEKFEHNVQQLLNLRSTPGSGNQWHDVSDGRSKPDDPYKIMVDCKYTEGKSYVLSSTVLQPWWDKATELGYHFALPVRLAGSKGNRTDWIAIPIDDYSELVDVTRLMRSVERCGLKPTLSALLCCRRRGHFGTHDNGEIEWSA